MSHEGSDTPNYSILASRFTSSGQWDRALETAREWLAQDPQNTNAHMTAGRALLNLKRHDEAASHLTQVLAGEPENDIAHRFMSIIHFKQKRFQAADEAIHRAISLEPNDAYHWYHLAYMFQQQGDFASAKKYAERAREISPRDADIINLLALCEPRDPATAARRFEKYQEALELDPENPEVHNNVGAYLLNTSKDYQAAEESFRRALFFNPSLKMARTNLFLTLKHRDRVYQVLCAPKDFIWKIFGFMREKRRQSLLLYLLLLPVWILAFRFILAGFVLWLLFVWPLVKVYEYLTIGDIRAQAGEIGAKRGGLFNYRRWPLKLRLSIFALSLVSFWGGVAFLLTTRTTFFSASDNVQALFGFAIFLGLLLLIAYWVRVKFKRTHAKFLARKRARRLGNLLDSARQEDE